MAKPCDHHHSLNDYNVPDHKRCADLRLRDSSRVGGPSLHGSRLMYKSFAFKWQKGFVLQPVKVTINNKKPIMAIFSIDKLIFGPDWDSWKLVIANPDTEYVGWTNIVTCRFCAFIVSPAFPISPPRWSGRIPSDGVLNQPLAALEPSSTVTQVGVI
jgi:hypothetical protein